MIIDTISYMNRCPTCRTELRPELVPAGTDGDFSQIWRCPNAENHGTLVPCRNECGKMVPNPEYHYSYTKGLLGSGRWSCLPEGRITAWIEHATSTTE